MSQGDDPDIKAKGIEQSAKGLNNQTFANVRPRVLHPDNSLQRKIFNYQGAILTCHSE